MKTNFFYNLLQKCLNIGIYDDLSNEDKSIISAINKFSVVYIAVNVILFFQDLLSERYLGVGIDIFMLTMLGICLLFNKYRLHTGSKLWLITTFTIILSVVMLNYGDNLHCTCGFLFIFTTIIMFFDNIKMIIALTLYLIFVWLGTEYYLRIHPEIVFIETSFLDCISAPLMSIFGTYLIILNYKNKVKENEVQLQNALIDSQLQNKKLNTANQELERFTFIMSHDLKTPVRTIVSFLNLIENKIKKQEYAELNQFIAFAKDGGIRLNSLIADILEFSKLNINEELVKINVDLDDVFRKTVQNLKVIIDERKANVMASNLGTIKTQEMLIGLLFQNLIENGIKFNIHDAPQIRVYVLREADTIKIMFQDDGIGINAEYQGSIFQIFTRLHTQQEFQGTGMGLAICKKIVERLDGTISLTSEPNVGTIFTLCFPN